ncbi:MAG: hypothetical protein ACPGQS_13710 [Bradymonadia bacterium]
MSSLSMTPGALSLDLGPSLFATLNGETYLSVLGSSHFPIAQTYPDPLSTDSYTSSPLELRLSPSLTLLNDGWFKVARLDMEYSLRGNAGGTNNATEGNRPPPLQRTETLDHELTELYATILGSHVGLEVGRLRQRFGLGMTAHPGVFDLKDSNVNEWGQNPLHGDIIERVGLVYAYHGLGTKKNGVTHSVGVERVVRDDRTDHQLGDSAQGFFAGVKIDYDTHEFTLGLVRREMTYREGGETEIWNLASAFKSSNTIKKYLLEIEGELNILSGSSTLPESVFIDGPFDVESYGAILRTTLRRGLHTVQLEGGLASGDQDRFDNVQSTFQFDPNYRIGLILFPMVNSSYARIAVENASDPNFRARLPRGASRTYTSGSIENAIYINPTWTQELTTHTKLSIGLVQAWRATPYFDLFRSNLNGGVPTDPLGRQDNMSLGQEVNLGFAHAFVDRDYKLNGYFVGAFARSSVSLPSEPTNLYASSVRLEASW